MSQEPSDFCLHLPCCHLKCVSLANPLEVGLVKKKQRTKLFGPVDSSQGIKDTIKDTERNFHHHLQTTVHFLTNYVIKFSL